MKEEQKKERTAQCLLAARKYVARFLLYMGIVLLVRLAFVALGLTHSDSWSTHLVWAFGSAVGWATFQEWNRRRAPAGPRSAPIASSAPQTPPPETRQITL